MAARRRKVRGWSKRRALALALALVGAVAGLSANAAPQLAVRFYDDNRLAQGSALSPAAQTELERVAGVALVPQGRDEDGAFRFAFALPASADAAAAAANRLRTTGAVVYADIVPDASATAAQRLAVPQQPAGSFIVALRPSAKRDPLAQSAAKARFAHKLGVAALETRPLSGGAELIVLDAALAPEAARAVLASLAGDPDVVRIEPNRRAHVTALPSDPMLPQQWNLTDAAGGINAPRAWEIATGDPGVPVAVLDTGLTAHPDLAGRVVAGYDFVSDPIAGNDGDGRDADPSDPGDWVTNAESATAGSSLHGCAVTNSTWHGTMVGGTIGAAVNNGNGVSGINWGSPIVNVRVLGKCGGSIADIADGIRWAAGLPVPGVPANPRPARVINLSMAGPGPCGPTLQSAVTDALTQGAILVAAAGNDNDDVENHWPANCNGVVAVAATSRNGSRAFYSSYGSRIAVSAPGGGVGGSIVSLRNASATAPDPSGYGYGQQLGTSLAAPHVTGAISLALSLDRDLTGAEARALIESSARPFPAVSADPCSIQVCGAGIVDAAAVLAALQPRSLIGTSPVPEPSPAPAPAPLPLPLPSPVVPPAADPAPVPAAIPPAHPAPVPGGWRAKRPEDLARLRKDDSVPGTGAALAPGSVSGTLQR